MQSDPAWRLGVLNGKSALQNYIAHVFVPGVTTGAILSVVFLLLVGIPFERTWSSPVLGAVAVGSFFLRSPRPIAFSMPRVVFPGMVVLVSRVRSPGPTSFAASGDTWLLLAGSFCPSGWASSRLWIVAFGLTISGRYPGRRYVPPLASARWSLGFCGS
jgi:hypothetical protein